MSNCYLQVDNARFCYMSVLQSSAISSQTFLIFVYYSVVNFLLIFVCCALS